MLAFVSLQKELFRVSESARLVKKCVYLTSLRSSFEIAQSYLEMWSKVPRGFHFLFSTRKALQTLERVCLFLVVWLAWGS